MPKKGPPKSYIESVENRLKRVENALRLTDTSVTQKMLDGSSKNDNNAEGIDKQKKKIFGKKKY